MSLLLIIMAPSTALFICIGAVIAFIFGFFQWKRYSHNVQLINSLGCFFLENNKAEGYKTFSIHDICQIKPVKENERLNALITEINLYVQKSVGTADFNIIQNKTERKIESLYEHATAELAFPTYIGLMGTFTGTFVGLMGFLMSGNDLSDEGKVTNLIIGVLVSMLTSLFGLILTTAANHKAAVAKKDLDEKKNSFLDFIQLEVIPKLQTTVTTLQQTLTGFVPRFDEVIGNFEKTFTGVIGRFKDTFDECTKNFGTEFRQNSRLIAHTVSTLNASIGHITENVENQRKLLEELRSEQMFETLQEFVYAAGTFQGTAKVLDDYNALLKELTESSKNVVSLQTEYARSLHVPQQIAIQLNGILDRITTFEQSINALGESLAQTQMLGNQELLLIKQHLESFEEKKQIADRFLDTSNEELTTLFREQGKVVKILFDNYQQQLETEREGLSVFVRETMQIITKKKNDLLTHLEHAFDISNVNAMFSHLKTLPDIEGKLAEIEQAIIRNEQLEQYIKKLSENLQLMDRSLNMGKEEIIDKAESKEAHLQMYFSQLGTILASMKASIEESPSHQVFSHLKILPGIEGKLEEIGQVVIRNEQLEQHIKQLSADLQLLNRSLNEGKTELKDQTENKEANLDKYFAQTAAILSSLKTAIETSSSNQVSSMKDGSKIISTTLNDISQSSQVAHKKMTEKLDGLETTTRSGFSQLQKEAVRCGEELKTIGLTGTRSKERKIQKDAVDPTKDKKV